MSYMPSLFRWLQRKRYQYEVTFSLYMLTPTEKFIFNSFLFLFLSMIIIAASLYLPEHISTIMRRAWFYWAGDETGTLKTGRSGVGSNTGLEGSGFDSGSSRMGNGYGGGDVLERLGSL